MKRLSFKNEPKIRVHKYIVAIISKKGDFKTTYKYCLNRKEVRLIKENLKRKHRMLVFAADHNFECGWENK